MQIVQNIPEDLLITVDRQRIQRVLVNLLVNALDVMPDGGTIRISAIPERHSVLIKVRDTGPGIAPEIRDRLFEPFATAGKADGLGLGLAFSRQAVLDHGGEDVGGVGQPRAPALRSVYRVPGGWPHCQNRPHMGEALRTFERCAGRVEL